MKEEKQILAKLDQINEVIAILRKQDFAPLFKAALVRVYRAERNTLLWVLKDE